MATTPNVSSNADSYIQSQYVWESILALRGNMEAAKRCTRITVLEPKNKGNKVIIPIAPTFTANTRTTSTPSSSDYTFDTPADSERSVTLTGEAYVAHKQSTLLTTFTNMEYQIATLKNMITAVAAKVEADVLNKYATWAATDIGTAGAAVTKELIAQAKKTLDDNYIPQQGRTLFLSTRDTMALLGDSWVANQMFAGSAAALTQGKLPQIYGFDVVTSQYLPLVGSDPQNQACLPSEILLVSATPTPPIGSVFMTVTDPDTNFTFQIYQMGDLDSGANATVVRALYAVEIRNTAAGIVITG